MQGGDRYTLWEKGTEGYDLIQYHTEKQTSKVLIEAKELIPQGEEKPLRIEQYSWSADERKVLLFTNSKRVWRSNTKGDYYVFDLDSRRLKQLGKALPSSSLMFAKFSPDNSQVAYVSDFNLYVEDYRNGEIRQLTTDGTSKVINGTFDWAYEEELACRDGFRWSPDGKKIAFWQIDASNTKTFYMINNTDSIYASLIPLQYPKVGEAPSAAKVGTVTVESAEIQWVDLPGDPSQHYLPRMQWHENDLLITQLNRKQNTLKLWRKKEGAQPTLLYTEKDQAWVDVIHTDLTASWVVDDMPVVDKGQAVLKTNETDGWRHLYKINLNDGAQTLFSPGEYDLARMYTMDQKQKYMYVNASPKNNTQRYLYRLSLDGKGTLKRMTPAAYEGVNVYNVSPNGKYAVHTHTSANSPATIQLIRTKDHRSIANLVDNNELKEKLIALKMPKATFFKVTTEEGIEMDGRIVKPVDFDPNKKYPVLFYVYGEPWGQTAVDDWSMRSLWERMLVQKGYIAITMDNRGTPTLKGREWRKSIYRKVGILNARDQAMAAKEVLKWDFIDEDRVAVWGWSGGGSMTLNLMFQYPEIYKTGMSIAPVANQLTYDNIYQERYMGLPSENKEDFIAGSPVTHAKGLQGNLLLVHGTGDDNVHYQNAEMVINELIKHNKQFQMMAYPNRSHGIWEGANTSRHLFTLLTQYLENHVKAGGVERPEAMKN
ncbi:S9 family peptidase [Algivirga pacifica]|uniref:S9 family peptidase n=2 Tax=Algivirga pacifica TaxID=1162670 RepID=A0ABP9D7H1_9BACT